jgi:hypothetical protein
MGTIPEWIGKYWEKSHRAVANLSTAQPKFAEDLWNIAFSSGTESEKDRAINAWTTTLNFGQEQLANFGGAASPVLEFPGVSQVGSYLAWMNKTAINRPVATAALAADQLDRGAGFFSSDTYRKAWNDSLHVSAGQALTYNAAQLTGIVDRDDKNFDPREAKQEYYNDWFFRTTSGSIDFALSLVDPLRGASKLALLGKARLVDKTLTEAQIAEGGLERQTLGKNAVRGDSYLDVGTVAPRVQKLYKQAQALDETTFNRLYFNQYTYGGVVSTALSAAAKTGDINMFSDVIMASRGSADATARIASSPGGASLANAIGTQRNAFNMADVVDRSADDAHALQMSDARRQSAEDAWIDQVQLGSPDGTPEFGTLANTDSALLGKGTPIVRPLYDSFREGIHQYGSGAYSPVQIAPWKSAWFDSMQPDRIARNAVRIASSSRGYASHLNVNLIGSYREFRANLERAGSYVDDETRNTYVTAYMAALTANERARIAGIADNFVIGRIASEHGMTKDEVQRLMRDASLRRQNFRTMLGAQQKFIPDQFQRRADALLRDGAIEESRKLQELVKHYKEQIKAGTMPAYADFSIDYRGRLVVAPRVDVENPILTSQVADYLPMVDYSAFNRAVQRFAKPRRTIERYDSDQVRIANGEKPVYNISPERYKQAKSDSRISAVTGTFNDVYDALNHVWSVAAVLRPAQTLRTLADDGMRSLTMIGMMPTIVNGSVGLGRIGYRLTRSGTTWIQNRQVFSSVRAAFGKSHHEINVGEIHAGNSASDLPSESEGFFNYIDPETRLAPNVMGDTSKYDSLESALVDGQIDLATYVDFVPWAARQGRVPHDLEALVEEFAGGLRGHGAPAIGRFRTDAATFALDRMGKITNYDRKAVIALATYALDQTGRAAFANPRWQAEVAEAVNSLRWRDDARRSRGLVVHPFEDDIKSVTGRRASEQYEFYTHTYLHPNPETKMFDDHDGIHDFVADNLDKFLAGGYRLHLNHASDGRIRLSVVRPKDMPKPFVERLSARDRRQMAEGLKSRGSAGLRFVSGHGRVEIPGSFTGTDGDFARTTISSSNAPYSTVRAHRNAERAVLKNNSVSRHDAEAFTKDESGNRVPNKNYDPSWERTVNDQLANDLVARQFLKGRTEAQVMAWLDSDDPQALRYLNDRPRTGFTTDDHVTTVRALVDYYLPPTAGQPLRDKVLRQEATGTELRAAIDPELLPPVNGQLTATSLGVHPAQQWVSKALDKWFDVMQNKPSDFLVRYPFYDTRYRGYFNPLFDNYVKQLRGSQISQTEVERLARMARQKAMDDTQRYLYDATFRTDAAKALSAVMPFSNAVADSLFKWSKIFREKPLETIANWNLVYNWPERSGIVYDQDGNSLHYDDGREVWHSVLDDSVMADQVEDADGNLVDAKHDKYVAFQPPSWIADKLPGGLKLVSFNKSSLTTAIFDPAVNAGPLIAYPVNRFALYKPEVGDNKFIKTYVLPFGPTDDGSKILLPGLIRAASNWYSEDYLKASSSAMAIFQTQLTDIQKGARTVPPSLDEAVSQARHEQVLRFLTSAGSPISFQYNSPYKPYADMYSQLLRKHSGDSNKAMEEFRTVAGDEYAYFAARVTKSNIALPATLDGYKKFQAKRDMIAKFPDLAGLITGGDGSGSFSKSVYEWEKRQTYDPSGKPIREEMTIVDSIDEVEKRTTWDNFTKFNAHIQNDLSRRGLHSLNNDGAEDLKAALGSWVESHMHRRNPFTGQIEVSPWYEDYRSINGARTESLLTQMRQILVMRPEWIGARPELQGLAQYLNARDDVKRAMTRYGYSSLGTQEAEWLQDQWQAQVFGFKQRNPAFGQVYDRWLSGDKLTAEGLAAEQIIAMLDGQDGGGAVGD